MTPGRHRTTQPASLAAVLTLAITLLVVLVIAVATAKASSNDRRTKVMQALIQHWPKPYRAEAFAIIDCESAHTFDPHVIGGGGLYWGLFQQGRWQRSRYGFGWSVRAQVRSAWRAFKANGLCWTCSSQWPVCGRGLD